MASSCSSDAASVAAETTEASAEEDSQEPLDPVQRAYFENYDEWSGHELAALVPSPEQLGPGWDTFGLELFDESPLFIPTEEEPGMDCGLIAPVVARAGLYAEFGYDGDVDDVVIVLSRDAPGELEALFDGLRTLTECPAQGELLGTVTQSKPASDMPGVIEAYRFESDDDLGQHQEGLLVRRADFVYLIDVFTQDGAAPIDLDALVGQLLSAYDGD